MGMEPILRMNNSDYNKPRTNTFEELPDVFQSPVNKSLLETTINRQLSKTEAEHVYGTVGIKNQNARRDLQIREDTPHRQAFQLQPMIYSKVATVNHVNSYVDILNKLELLGVDTNRIKEWGNTEQFNFAPPITIDKFINYHDYVWYDPVNVDSKAQYVTIQDECSIASARYHHKMRELSAFGVEREIIHVENQNGKNYFTIFENFTDLFVAGQTFDVTDSVLNDGIYTVISSEYLSGSTYITVAEPIPDDNYSSGVISFSTILQQLRNDEAIVCTGGYGWDIGGWDDDVDNFAWDSFGPYAAETNPWKATNHWVHKLNVPTGVYNRNQLAKSPIIEYSSTIEMNEWNVTGHVWKTRVDTTAPWVVSDREPTLVEINSVDFLDTWVLVSTTETTAVNHQVVNTTSKLATTNLPSQPVDMRTLVPVTTKWFNIVNVTVPLTPEDDLTKQLIAGSGDARVFLNGIQQFGTYREIADVNNEYLVAVEFFKDITSADVVEVYLTTAAQEDVGREDCRVRTIENDVNWANYLTTTPVPGLPPRISITRFRRLFQSKMDNEIKYPLFDLFNIDGTTAYKASPIFRYVVSSSAPVVDHLQQRVVVNNKLNYEFEQLLVDSDNGPIKLYKDTASTTPSNPQGLQSIWQISPDLYVPKFVDGERHEDGEVFIDRDGFEQVAQVDSSNGFWEIPNQLFYNAMHENRKQLSFLELFEHFKSNLATQVAPIGFSATPREAVLLMPNSEYEYGTGGIIKEHNDSYDSFISSIVVDNTTPISTVEFAKTEYERALNTIKEDFRSLVYGFMLVDTYDSMIDLDSLISDFIITRYETNDSANLVFGDSNTYNSTTNQGVKSWPATLPYIRMAVRSRPVKLVDPIRNISQLRHHDGHLSTNILTYKSILMLTKNVIATVIDNTGRRRGWDENTTGGMADNGPISTRLSVDWNRLLPNDYWLDTDGIFYRLELAVKSPTTPTDTLDIPIGSYWLRSTDGILMVRDNSMYGWSPVNNVPNDLTSAWRVIDFNDMLLNVLLEVETRLYDAAITTDETQVVFPRSSYVLTPADEHTHQQYTENNFNDYCKRARLSDPYATDYNAADPFTWNYSDVTVADSPFAVPVSTLWAPRWHTIYQNSFNTPYPHLEPWKLQLFTDKPTWWDDEYKDTTGNRRWVPQMWVNILAGVVPTSHVAPAGIHGYNFVSVNITNAPTSDGKYAPDDLLPPHWIPPSLSDPIDQQVKDMVFIRTPISFLVGVDFAKGYEFGDEGPIEWRWRQTTDFLYGEMITSFRMQPVRYTHYTLGVDYTIINGLQLSTELQKVYSHVDATFHGDLNSSNQLCSYPGTLQWYVNYNRSNSYDIDISDFRPLWASWQPFLSYQFGGMIDTRSLDVRSNVYDVLVPDRDIIVKRSPNIQDQWLDALTVTVGQFGRARTRGGFKVPYGNGADWKFIIDTPAITTREVEVYTARNYVFTVVDAATGLLESNQALPWVVGDKVELLTTIQLPSPLSTMSSYYFVPGPNAYQFYLADSKQDAISNLVFTYSDQFETGEHRITQLSSTFSTTGQSSEVYWRHHALNSEVTKVSFPHTVSGAQQVIDFIDGYSRRMQDVGFVFNSSDYAEVDVTTGRVISWQFETEKLMDVIYTGLGVNNTPGDYQGKTYQFISDMLTDQLVIPDLTVPYSDGQEVFVFSTGVLPIPLLLNTPYYIIRVPNELNKFKLARTKDEALAQIAIDVRGNGTGAQFIGSFQSSSALSSGRHQVNPFKHNVWFKTPQGVVTNMVDGPYSNIRSDQTVFDQYGRPFNSGDILILREDKLTRLIVRDGIPNDLLSSRINEGDTELTIGGMHIFVDGYEHVMRLNNYTANGNLVFDSFLGVCVHRLLVDYYSQTEKNQRPVMGGYVLNEKEEMIRNIEGSIEDIQQYYDSFAVNDNAQFIEHARKTIGFTDPKYLDQLGVTDKTKFLFWKGLLQTKGSVKAVKAFINSIQFVDAKVDDYWAYRIAEYGDSREVSFPEIKMSVNDARRDDVKYQFTNGTITVEDGFDEVSSIDDTRWVDFPSVADRLSSTASNSIQFETKVWTKTSYRYGGQPGDVIERYDDITKTWTAIGSYGDPYIVLDVPCDNVELFLTSGNVGSPQPTIYNQINSRILHILPGYDITFDVFTKIPNNDALDPSTVVDYGSNTTVSVVPMWDPDRGQHYSIPYSVVDYATKYDPVTVNTTESGWAEKFVGYSWLDTSMLAYKPYYDRSVFSTTREQLLNWGKITDWATLKVYEWVKSPVMPDQYVTSAGIADINMPEKQKISGFPVKKLQRRTMGSPNVFEFVNEYDELHIDWWVAKPQPTVPWPATATFTMYVNGSVVGDQSLPGPYGYSINTIIMSEFDDVYNSDIKLWYTAITGKTLTNVDHVHLVRNVTSVDYDSGEFSTDYEFVTITEMSPNGVDTVDYYYFWVESRSIVAPKKIMSTREAEKQLTKPNISYQLVRRSGDTPYLQDFYDQLIVRDMSTVVTTDNRYALQLTRNFTLRDTVRDNSTKNPAMLKNVHTEWNTIRRRNNSHPPIEMWNKATEAVVGYDLVALELNQYLPVPSLDRVLYDNKYGTTTRFGLQPGLAMLDPTLALNTVLSVINKPDFDPQPVNKFDFMSLHDFTTPKGRKAAMEGIYNSFPSSAVNDILFELILDAFTMKPDYPDMFKTSWVAIHGIRLLESKGNVSGF